jgi:hypothetical protein
MVHVMSGVIHFQAAFVYGSLGLCGVAVLARQLLGWAVDFS